jgi:hypothetical protein
MIYGMSIYFAFLDFAFIGYVITLMLKSSPKGSFLNYVGSVTGYATINFLGIQILIWVISLIKWIWVSV